MFYIYYDIAIINIKYSGTSAGLTIYEDSLRKNIVVEFSLNEFLKENQIRSPVVRKEYVEVQEINMVSYFANFFLKIHILHFQNILLCFNFIHYKYKYEYVNIYLKMFSKKVSN